MQSLAKLRHFLGQTECGQRMASPDRYQVEVQLLRDGVAARHDGFVSPEQDLFDAIRSGCPAGQAIVTLRYQTTAESTLWDYGWRVRKV